MPLSFERGLCVHSLQNSVLLHAQKNLISIFNAKIKINEISQAAVAAAGRCRDLRIGRPIFEDRRKRPI